MVQVKPTTTICMFSSLPPITHKLCLQKPICDVKVSGWYFLTLYLTVTSSVTKKSSCRWHHLSFHLTLSGLVSYFTIIQLPLLLLKKTQWENNHLVQLKVISCGRTGNHPRSSKPCCSDTVGQPTGVCSYFREGARAPQPSIFCSKNQKLLLVEQNKQWKQQKSNST